MNTLGSQLAKARLALAVLALAPAAAAQGPPAAASLAEVNAELVAEEQAQLAAFLARLSAKQKTGLFQFLGELPVGVRGIVTAKLLNAPADQKSGVIGYLAAGGPEERAYLTRYAGRPPQVWDEVLRGLAGFPDAVILPAIPVQVTHGVPAPPFSAPWQVQIFRSGASASPLTPLELRRERENFGIRLRDFERWHQCGGVLIAPTWVLTAAHCIKDPPAGPYLENRRVRTGTNDITKGGTSWRIAAVVKHGGYDSRSKVHDIALLKIAADGLTDRSATAATRPIPLATLRDPPLRAGEPLTITGWGVTGESDMNSAYRDRSGRAKRSSPVLMQAFVNNQPLSLCNDNPNFRRVGAKVGPGQICAGGEGNRDACQGDSGGPLVRRDSRNHPSLVGLVSFGPGCGLDNTPGVYADVRHYGGWIREAMSRARDGQVLSWPPPASPRGD